MRCHPHSLHKRTPNICIADWDRVPLWTYGIDLERSLLIKGGVINNQHERYQIIKQALRIR